MVCTHMHVAPGFVVRAFFDHRREGDPKRNMIVRVTDVQKRYGNPREPLVVGRDVETGEEEFFSVHFVTQILEIPRRSVCRPPRNIFREQPLGFMVVTDQRGVTSGSLGVLAGAFLAESPLELDRPIDNSRLRTLYRKDGSPGFLGLEPWGGSEHIRVHKRAFRKWVLRNATAVLMTARAYDAEIDARNAEWEKQYWADVDAELDRDLDLDLDLDWGWREERDFEVSQGGAANDPASEPWE